MAEYSGKKQIISALMRRYTDRIPVTVLIGPYCSRLTNYSVKEISRQPFSAQGPAWKWKWPSAIVFKQPLKEAAIFWHPAAKFPWIQQKTESAIFLTMAVNMAGSSYQT